jgi:hypothetical protein
MKLHTTTHVHVFNVLSLFKHGLTSGDGCNDLLEHFTLSCLQMSCEKLGLTLFLFFVSTCCSNSCCDLIDTVDRMGQDLCSHCSVTVVGTKMFRIISTCVISYFRLILLGCCFITICYVHYLSFNHGIKNNS